MMTENYLGETKSNKKINKKDITNYFIYLFFYGKHIVYKMKFFWIYSID